MPQRLIDLLPGIVEHVGWRLSMAVNKQGHSAIVLYCIVFKYLYSAPQQP